MNSFQSNKTILKPTIYIVLFFLFSCQVFDVKSETFKNEFVDFSLEQLINIPVTTAAKKPQKLSLAASSIFVLNQQDIKRSGVTTIPDALRMVPGVQVAKLDANKWAISIRGFNDIFSNKLLILMDGRTVYSPFFGGAYWDTIDTVLEDIDRIEVVRGPGGTLWGSNAVNGVINIITKTAKDSAGLLVSAHAGNEERGKLSIRYGGDIGQHTDYRVYVKGFEKDEAEDGVDDWRMGRAGLKIDSEPSQKDKMTLQSEVYAGEEGERAVSNIDIPPFGTFASQTDVFGAHVLFRWQRDLGDDSDLIFQTYYDRTEREHFYVTDMRDTVDFDFQHRFQTFWNQEINWGLGFRYIADETGAGTVMSLSPRDRSDRIYSAFIQDEISLIEDQLILTLGTKVEHNSYTGFEYQPSARLLWKPFDQHSFWGSVSRAVRIPSRVEQDMMLQRTFVAPELALNINGSRDMDAEELIAYEIGYRFLDKQYSVDISLFYNDYDDLRSLETAPIIFGTTSILPLVVGNEIEGEVYGLDIAASWDVHDNWRLRGGYSFTQIQLHPSVKSTDITEEGDEGDTPHHQFTISSFWQVSENWQLDTALRYVDKVNEVKLNDKKTVDSYVTVDMRVAWQVNQSVEFSINGQNLLGKHREFRGSTVKVQATDVEPSVFFQVDLHY